MDIIAEDLGYLTESVIKLVEDTGYPGMKVLQFAFDSREESNYLPHNYPHNCVVYTGTHDNNTVRGWLDEMCRKTLIREVFSAKHIVRDPEKLDEDYRVMKAREVAYAEIQAEAEIQEQANTVLIDTAPQPAAPASLPEPKKTIQVDASTGEVLEPQAAPAAKPTSRKAAPAQWDVAEPDF